MRNNPRFILFVALIVTLALASCRAVTDPEPASPTTESAAPAESSDVEKTDTPTPEATRPPAADGTFPTSAQVAETIAGLPIPGPDAVVPTPASLQAEEMTTRGPADADVTIVEFSDYQCPYCRRYVEDAYSQVIEAYVDAGHVRYVFKDFPLEQIHPQAKEAAEAARCAGEQGDYWAMHDQLFAAQDSWAGQSDPTPIFVDLASGLGLDGDALQACLDSGRYTAEVEANLAEGRALGVTGTPTFFINGYPIPGAQPFEVFQLALGLANVDRISDAFAREPTPTPMPIGDIPIEGWPAKGDEDAPVVMIEYSDYQCPYCARYVQETLAQIDENYIQTGKVRYIFKDFPLDFHDQAMIAAQAARCAGDQDAYWGMHDLLFANQAAWANAEAAAVLTSYAEELGLDVGEFDSCVTSMSYEDAIKADRQEGMSVGVSGTPSFVVGGQFISGAQPYEAFAQAIEAALDK